jgi:hypothetical protein
MIPEVSFCGEHAGMTCCGQQDDRRILSHVHDLKTKSNPRASLDCLEKIQESICSRCDGMKGVGSLKGMCHYKCEEWY